MQRITGVTFIELIITLSIIALLTAIGLPSYQHYQHYAHRKKAQLELISVAVNQAAFLSRYNNYGSLASLAANTNLTIDTNSDKYKYEMTLTGSYMFEAKATAINQQTKDAGCLTLTINEKLIKAPSACW